MATKAIMVVLMLISTIICCCAMQDETKAEKGSLMRSQKQKPLVRSQKKENLISKVLSASGHITPDQAVGADMAPESATPSSSEPENVVTSHAAIGLAMKKRAGGGSGSHSTHAREPAQLDEVVSRKEDLDKIKSVEHGNCMAALTTVDGDDTKTQLEEVACDQVASASLKWALNSCNQVKLKDVDRDLCLEACTSTKNTYGRSCVTSICTPSSSLTDADSDEDKKAHSNVLDQSLLGKADATYKLQQWSSTDGRIYTKDTYDDDTDPTGAPTHYCLTSSPDDAIVQTKPCCKLTDASAFVQDHETHLDQSLLGKSEAFGKTCNTQERANQHWELA